MTHVLSLVSRPSKLLALLAVVCSTASLASGCGASTGNALGIDASTATGGTSSGTGGTTATGGSPAVTGGTSSTGGVASNMGGVAASGGAGSTGGTPATGGGVATSGGATASGGSAATGGTVKTGGATATGGSAGSTPGTGGSGSGGASGTGGTGTGGGAKTGGAVATGGSAGGVTGTGGGTSAGGTSGGGVTTVTGLPTASAILASMRSANGWFMTQHPDPGGNADASHKGNLWTRAAYFEGLMGLYNVETDATKKTSYHDYVVKWGTAFSWQTYNSVASSNADEMACGQTYIDIYNVDKQASYIKNITTAVRNLVTTQPATGSANSWWWIDAIQMAMPSFAKLGVLNNDTSYFDGMWAMYNDSRTKEGGGLWNPTDGLWWRDKSFVGTKAPNGKSVYWSRGNGWVITALARVLDILPTTDAHRATYVSDFQAMAKALIALQRTDGFWNESLFDPTHCASSGKTGQDGPETSGTGFFTYGLAWGIRTGLLDSATYSPAVQKAWNGLSTIALQSNGLMGYVQPTGSAPCSDTAALGPTRLANFDDYGVGAFLLAGSEVYKLASN